MRDRGLERFQDKWTRLSVAKTQRSKNLEPGSDLTKTGKAPAHEIASVSRVFPRLRSRLVSKAENFLGRNPKGVVVTFIDEFENIPLAGEHAALKRHGITGWRSVLKAGEHERLWRQAYRSADGFVETLGGELEQLLVPYYHTIADYMHQALVLKQLLASSDEPVMAIMSGSIKAYEDFPATVYRLASLPDGFALMARRAALVLRTAFNRIIGAAKKAKNPSLSRQAEKGFLKSKNPGNDAGNRADAHILIAVQEGVAAVNSPSAFAIARALGKEGAKIVILTPNRNIRQRALALGLAVLCPVELRLEIISTFWWRFYNRCRKQLTGIIRSGASGSVERYAALVLKRELGLWAALHASAQVMLEHYHRNIAPVKAGLLVNEGTPVSGQALGWLRQNNIPDMGYWPALLGTRADCDYFPASRHLVYGAQLAAHMQRIGVPADKVEMVGSVNYDLSLGRNQQDDIACVRRQILPGWKKGQTLVVVASEALPGPFEELGPVLRALETMQEVAVVLKLHPADKKAVFDAHLEQMGLKDRVVVVGECDLDALLHAADLLICVLSNIIVNAAVLGTPTLVCDFSMKRRPLDFVKEGLALGCFEQSALEQMIPDMLPGGKFRETALALLHTGLKGFNNPPDGGSAQRIAHILARAARNDKSSRGYVS